MPLWKRIVRQVGLQPGDIVRESAPEHDICAVRMLVSGMCAEEGSYLYLVRSSDLPHVQLKGQVSLVVLDDTGVGTPELSETPCNCALVSQEKAPAVVREINWVFTVFAQIDMLLSRLQSHVANGEELSAMVGEVAEAFGYPVDVLDNSFCFIATGRDQNSELRQAYAQTGARLPVHILQDLRSSGKLKQLVESTGPVLVEHPKEGEDFAAWLTPLVFNRVKLGYLAIFCPGKPTKDWLPGEYVNYLHYVADFFSMAMSRRDFYTQNKGEVFSYVLSSLLESDRTDLEEVRQRLKLGGYELQKKLYLLCVRPLSRLAGEQWSERVATHLRDLFSNSIYVHKDGKLYYLISRSDKQPVSDYEQTIWSEYLYSSRLCGGLTGPFEDFGQMQNRRLEAELTLSICIQKKKPLLRFQTSQIEALAEYLRWKNASELFYHRPTLALIDYDRGHGTRLVETLLRYLKNPKEPNAICEELNIHKNTLYKRLDKIRDVMGVDITEADTIMQFRLTLYLMEH